MKAAGPADRLRDRKLLIVSPHYDDAVLSCGWLMLQNPGARVLTVLGGVPQNATATGDWDRKCGFASANDAISARRREDQQALTFAKASSHPLEFVDHQYREPQSTRDIIATLVAAIDASAADCVVVPMGLHHPDHIQSADAAIAAWLDRYDGSTPLLLYEDVPYRALDGVLAQRLATLQASGLALDPAGDVDGDRRIKQRMAECYGSQWQALENDDVIDLDDAFTAERFWWVTPVAVPAR